MTNSALNIITQLIIKVPKFNERFALIFDK